MERGKCLQHFCCKKLLLLNKSGVLFFKHEVEINSIDLYNLSSPKNFFKSRYDVQRLKVLRQVLNAFICTIGGIKHLLISHPTHPLPTSQGVIIWGQKCKIDVFSCGTSEQRSDRVYSSDNQGSTRWLQKS